MKNKLSNFIKENKDKFDINDLTSSHIIFKKYKKDNFDYSNYIKDRICVMKKSPDLFICLISSLSFEINLKLYINQSFGTKQNIYKSDSYKNEISVDLIYSNGYYLISYSQDYYNIFKSFHEFIIETDNNNLITFIFQGTRKGNENEELESNKQNEINEDSDMCDSDDYGELISAKVPICKSCVIKNVNKVLSNRLNYLIEDNYDNIEYYTRDIEFEDENEKKNKIISPLEFKYLYGTNSTIYKKLTNLLKKNICLQCKNPLSNESKIQLECGCKFCKKCIREIILEETCNKIFLNDLEKKEIKCRNCKKEIVINSSIYNSCYNEEELREFKENAHIRQKDSYNNLCINCGKQCNEKKNKIIEFSNINDDYHIICEKCNEKIENENINNKTNSISIRCKICGTIHSFEYPKIKKKNSPNCPAKCSIY